MRCFFTLTIAAVLAVGMSATTWSQSGGGGGTGGAGGGAGSSGGSASGGTGSTGTGNTAGTAGAAGTADAAGTAGAAGSAGTAGNVGTAGTAGNVGSSGQAGTAGATNRAPAAGTAGIGTDGRPGVGRDAAGANRRANTNAGLNNAAARANLNGQFDSVSRTPFFSDPGVRRQLNLNDTQFNALNNAYGSAYTRYNQAINNLSPNLTPEQRTLQMQQLQSRFNQDLSGSLNSTITNPQSLSRYNQLNRQFMGFNAFNDPNVRQQLNLSQDQIRQLRTLSNNWRQQLQRFRRGAGNDLNSVDTAQWNQMWQQYASQLNSVLSPEQQQLWSQQVGSPFVFSPDVYMGARQSDTVRVDNPPAVDPTAPVFFPNTAAGGTTPEGTQTPSGTQATTQGTTPQGTSAPATQGGTVR